MFSHLHPGGCYDLSRQKSVVGALSQPHFPAVARCRTRRGTHRAPRARVASFSRDALEGGGAALNMSQARGRIGTATRATDLTAEIPRLDLDPANKALQLTGQVRLDNTEMDVGVRKLKRWWSEISVPSARLLIRHNLDISGVFRAAMRDATPALAFLESESTIPSWLTTIVPFRRMSTEGVVERHCRLADIRFDRTVAGPRTVRGRLLSTSD